MNISRQGFYKKKSEQTVKEFQEEVILELVREVRWKLPRIGGKKLYRMLKKDLRYLGNPGRDKFFEILRDNGLLVEPLKQYVITTNSHHRFWVYSNLIKELAVEGPNKVFVSDITYIRLTDNFCYLFLVTDVYSRKIVGYHLSMGLGAQGAVRAMEMALQGVINPEGLIHHSDRGFQYCSNEYVELLKKNGIQISMGQAGNPYDNAIAERVNGILKTEFYLNSTYNNFEIALQAVTEAIATYNDLRPHMSIGYLTPNQKYAA